MEMCWKGEVKRDETWCLKPGIPVEEVHSLVRYVVSRKCLIFVWKELPMFSMK